MISDYSVLRGDASEERVIETLVFMGFCGVVRHQKHSHNDKIGIDITFLHNDITRNVQVKTSAHRCTKHRHMFRHDERRRKIIIVGTMSRSKKTISDKEIAFSIMKQLDSLDKTGYAWF